MKYYNQRKRNIIDIGPKQDECVGMPVKKSANGVSQGHQKATETKKVPHLESQIQPHISPAKVKLQLFPINEETRTGLEKDGHNPFLELTLNARKRISSVVKHLNTKWGSSNVILGQLMLFPYNTKSEQVASCKRWTLNDSAITAWEVYVDVGQPSIFRLRYGWCPNLQHGMFEMPPKTSLHESHADSEGRKISSHENEKIDESFGNLINQTNANEALHSEVNEKKYLDVLTGFLASGEATEVVSVHSSVPWDDNLTNLSIGGILAEISRQGKNNDSYPKSDMQPIKLKSDISTRLENESSLQHVVLTPSDISIGGLLSESSLYSNKNKLVEHAQIQSPWYDDLTSLSIGGLFSEASLQAKVRGDLELKEAKSSLQANTHIFDPSDSLNDVRLKTLPQMPKPPSHNTNLSILDAEETCHAFPVRKVQTDGGTTTSNVQLPIPAETDKLLPTDFFCQELKTSPFPHSPGPFNEGSNLKPASRQSDLIK